MTRLVLALLALLRPVAAGRLQSDDGDKGVSVRLLLARHAFSCANAVEQFGGTVYSKSHVFMEDPMLTDCGVHRSKQAGEHLIGLEGRRPDLVLTSSLLRAMETAAFMYPSQNITPCPYISEDGIGIDNSPMKLREQLDALKTTAVGKRHGLSADRLDLRWMDDATFSGDPRTKPSWRNFKKFMASTLLPGLPASLRNRDLTIAVVTHSHFLNSIPEVTAHCGSYFDEKPRNNQVFELWYRFTSRLLVHDFTAPEPIATKAISSYATARSGLWEEVGDLLGDGKHRDDIIGSLVTPEYPPWKAGGFSVQVKREFRFQPGAGCMNLVSVAGKDAHLCEKDLGDVCKAEISRLSGFTRPRIKFVEQKAADAHKDFVKYHLKGDSKKEARASEKLEEYSSFACCTA